MLDGAEVTTCPYIWVDTDFALVRGWIQGFPKKLGRIHMTRSFGLDCRAEGRTFAGTLSANGHRLAQGTVTPERAAESGPTHNDPPLVNRPHFPRLAAGRAPYLHRLADLIDANVERLATVECLDMAMLERSLRARVIGRGARNYRSYADLAAGYEERAWSSNGTANRVIRMPSGPAAVITPWNAPFMLSTWKT